jgi:translation initiation factor IF-2
MSDVGEERTPETQPAFSGRPPRPPKITARDLEDQPDDPGKTVYLPDPVVVKDLASALVMKPFKIVADLIAMGQFRHADETVAFETAWIIARKHGYWAERIS